MKMVHDLNHNNYFEHIGRHKKWIDEQGKTTWIERSQLKVNIRYLVDRRQRRMQNSQLQNMIPTVKYLMKMKKDRCE